MDKIYDVIIIGGGPAGYSAARYTSRAALSTLVIERMSIGGQMALTDIIDNYPGFDEGVDGFTLGMKMQSGAERFGSETLYSEVTSVSLEGKIKTVTTTDATYSSRTVIIATGANPRELGIERESELVGKGIHYCAHCDGRFYKGKRVVVVGGGNSAVSDALYLSGLASEVILVHRRDTLRATHIYHDPLMKASNVSFAWNSTVGELYGDTRLQGIRLDSTVGEESRKLDCDAVFVSIGRKPATELFDSLELDTQGYIVADETTRTNIEGVFAAGDVRTKALRQVVTAASDGATAAHFVEEYLALNG